MPTEEEDGQPSARRAAKSWGVVLKQENQMVPKPVSIGIDVIRFARAKSVDFENKIWAKTYAEEKATKARKEDKQRKPEEN